MEPLTRRRLLGLARAAVSVSLIAFLLSRLNFDELRDLASTVTWARLLLAPGLLLLAMCVASVRWRLLLRRFGVELGFWSGLHCYMIGEFYGLLMPGVVGGDVVRIGMGARITHRSAGEVATTVLLERSTGLLVFIAIGAIAFQVVPSGVAADLGDEVRGTLTTFGVFALIFLFAPLLAPSRRAMVTWGERFRRPVVSKAVDLLQTVIQLPNKARLELIGMTLLGQLLVVLAAIELSGALNLPVPPIAWFVIMPLTSLATALPISLGGLGVREATLTFLLLRMGATQTDAVTLAGLLYLSNVTLGMMGGLWHLRRAPRAQYEQDMGDAETGRQAQEAWTFVHEPKEIHLPPAVPASVGK